MSLTLTGVTLTYPDGESRVTALDDVSLSVEPGTVTAVVGPSGSGKSSLLAVAATLVRPERGQVVVGGVDTGGLRESERARLRRRHVGVVFQQSHLLPSLTVSEQLRVMAHLDGRPRRVARERADELIEAVGLSALAGRRPHQLSGGQRQRVNIARALVNEPSVVLADEPTSALDRHGGEAIVDLLVNLTRDRGTATLVVTHDHRHLDRVDDVVEVVDGGLSTYQHSRAGVLGVQ